MTTTRLLILILVALVMLMFATAIGATPASPTATPSVVMIFSRGIDGTSCGNAFLVGDGTLIVTARSVVFPRRLNGLHEGDAFVTVLSPHLGDVAEAQVLAQDRELDLVLLRGPQRWRGHPALRVAEESELVDAEKLELVGYADALTAVTGGTPGLLVAPPRARQAELDVNAVLVRRSATRSITTLAAPPGPGPGWAGAPMLVTSNTTDKTAVAGCYVRTQADGRAGVGAACGAIRRLIDAAGLSAALQ